MGGAFRVKFSTWYGGWEYKLKVAYKNKIEAILAVFLRRPLKLVITGSTVSGVGTSNSDADICMCIPNYLHPLSTDYKNGSDKPEPFTKNEKRRRTGELLRSCKRQLDNSGLGLKIVFIDAMIPLLKMKGDVVDEVTGNNFTMEIDLSVSNDAFISSLHNSHLIRGYARVDARFAPLVTLVKEWSGVAGVRDGQHRRFNSYTMTLLVIHFLQCGLSRPILPNLQGCYPEFFALSDNNYPNVVDFNDQLPYPLPDLMELPPSGLSVAELFYLFLAYYSTIDLRKLVIRVNCGRITERGFAERHEMDKHGTCNEHIAYPPYACRLNEVYIQDVIDEHNPGRTVDDWELVRDLFADALLKMQSMFFGFPKVVDLIEEARYRFLASRYR